MPTNVKFELENLPVGKKNDTKLIGIFIENVFKPEEIINHTATGKKSKLLNEAGNNDEETKSGVNPMKKKLMKGKCTLC